jgi:glycosyltransferase involved in cell wall biosynthesis
VREKLRREFGIADAFVIGHIGRFSPQKNHEYIIDIFREVNRRKRNAALLLVGRGELEKRIADKVNKFRLADKVIFAGVRSDVNELLQAMDVFLFPSLYEGLGIVAIEAQAAGLPCVIADAIPKEVVITPLVKQLSTKSPPSLWADAILKCDCDNRMNTRQLIIDAGYDIETTVAWLPDFYEQIVESQTNGSH